MSNIRQAAVAGMFYPGNASELEHSISEYLSQAPQPDKTPRAIIAPHAGYIYSGPTAAYAYKALEPIKQKIKRVILFGPSHRVPLYGCALSSADYFETPLGTVPIDRAANQALIENDLAREMDAAHLMEHSLEVHLPFLQYVLDKFTLVPIVVGDASPQEVGDIIEYFWNDESNFFVVSSDLSHYHSYQVAQSIDHKTSEAIVNCDTQHISSEQACGCRPVNGLLSVAQKHHLHVAVLDQRNSGDTAGSKDQVVGYGAYAVY
ncbi:MAG: AmmeMemoRadiSam system protein B [Gammaproteobacteria bacterium]|nr:AmmeMemoRadiSam system protein B [Gammaproteobacteria bacterium]